MLRAPPHVLRAPTRHEGASLERAVCRARLALRICDRPRTAFRPVRRPVVIALAHNDRYHATIIRSPKQARHELAYVLNNWRKHGEHRKQIARGWKIDPFARGWLFQGWKEREHEPFAWRLRETYEPIPVWWPRTWLLTEGWRRHGLISTHEVPGDRFVERART